jgi:hypothetical protein
LIIPSQVDFPARGHRDRQVAVDSLLGVDELDIVQASGEQACPEWRVEAGVLVVDDDFRPARQSRLGERAELRAQAQQFPGGGGQLG